MNKRIRKINKIIFIWYRRKQKLTNVNNLLTLEKEALPVLMTSSLQKDLIRIFHLKESKYF